MAAMKKPGEDKINFLRAGAGEATPHDRHVVCPDNNPVAARNALISPA
jgi:hypothetical protein